VCFLPPFESLIKFFYPPITSIHPLFDMFRSSRQTIFSVSNGLSIECLRGVSRTAAPATGQWRVISVETERCYVPVSRPSLLHLNPQHGLYSLSQLVPFAQQSSQKSSSQTTTESTVARIPIGSILPLSLPLPPRHHLRHLGQWSRPT